MIVDAGQTETREVSLYSHHREFLDTALWVLMFPLIHRPTVTTDHANRECCHVETGVAFFGWKLHWDLLYEME